MKTLLNLIVLLLVISCSKDVKVTNSKLKLALGNLASGSQLLTTSSGKVVSHLVINISGPGITRRIFQSWDSCANHDCSVRNSLPEISFSIPSGKDRLIQVFAVFASPSDQSEMEFYYGDTTKSFTLTYEEVGVTITSLGGSNVRFGSIIGRYVNTTNSGPTGKLSLEYQPSGTKPSMMITQAEIFNGWFEAFAIENFGFNYILDSGETLFSNVSLNSATFTNSNQVMQINLPPSYYEVRSYNYNNVILNSTPNHTTNSDALVYGFWGPGAANNSVCYSTQTSDIQNTQIYDIYGTPSFKEGLYLDSEATQPLKWKSTFDANHLSRVGSAGGVAKDNSACDSTKEYLTQITINPKNIKNDKSGLAGFRGPFKIVPANLATNPYDRPSYLKVQLASATNGSSSFANVNLNWNYLPDSGITGVSLFKKIYSTEAALEAERKLIYAEVGYQCNELLNFGFTKVTTIDNTSTTSYTLVNETKSDFSTTVVLLCPYRIKASAIDYFETALQSEFRYLNYQVDTSMFDSPTAKISFTSASPANVTTPYIKGTLNDNSTSHIRLYSDSSCSIEIGNAPIATFTTGTGISAKVGLEIFTSIYARGFNNASTTTTNDQTTSCIWLTTYAYFASNPTPTSASITYSFTDSTNSTFPKIKGTADSTLYLIKLYNDSSCTTEIGSGSTNEFMGSGISSAITQNSITSIYAQGFDSSDTNTSCIWLTTYAHGSIVPSPIHTVTNTAYPSSITAPSFQGTADSRITTLKFFRESNCAQTTTSLIGSGTRSEFESSVGIDITVNQSATTAIYVQGFDSNSLPITKCAWFNAYTQSGSLISSGTWGATINFYNNTGNTQTRRLAGYVSGSDVTTTHIRFYANSASCAYATEIGRGLRADYLSTPTGIIATSPSPTGPLYLYMRGFNGEFLSSDATTDCILISTLANGLEGV